MIDLTAPSARRLVAASNSAPEAAEARPPRAAAAEVAAPSAVEVAAPQPDEFTEREPSARIIEYVPAVSVAGAAATAAAVMEPAAAEVTAPEVTESDVSAPEVVEAEVAQAEVETAEADTDEGAIEAPELAATAHVETEAAEAEAAGADAPESATSAPATAEPEAGAVEGEVEDPAHVEEAAAAPAYGVRADDVPTSGVPSAAPAVGPAAVLIRGLVKRFGDTAAVDGVDLTVPAGSFYGLVGPNGAGKTTTLSIISGLLRPDAGTVHISGIDQRAKPLEAKRMMGVLPDRLRTFDRLTGRQLLFYYGQLRGLKRPVIESRTADLARAFDLTEALSRVVSDYSAGMTKKLMLAGALIHSPRVLVLDEPFEAVDPVSSGVILDILGAYVSHGGTVILSSHGMDLVEQVCSRVAVIVGGEVLAEGTIDEVRAGQTLTQRFVELSGSGGEVEGLEWLHTFSD
ncbi:ABC transporter ATP-binding protein [Microbacterium sp. H1-D42]|uniref:ABC transporter ATP-binding protein n=1 Tax=Microbacterium sp. H1-D42 TaxID=2925844 RepID=UPI001F5369B9|nr:ABC transporter ATP-binding protein [Microbacterium sp. H1-D42]UNK71969.1 ATP-binding cassette domain-containing protein [Microbacterium sp. H1-D42]